MKLKYFFIAFLLSSPFWLGINFFQKNLEKFFYAQIGQPFEGMVFVQIPERVQKPKLELEAKSAISLKINGAKEKILFQKNPEEILPIASLTKLMTAVIVLDSNPPTTHPTGSEVSQNYYLENTWITISPEAANQKDVPVYGNLKAGERFNLKQLLDLTLIYSSNDAAWALAENFAPVVEQSSLQGFVEKMNQKTGELELENTNFVNSTGLDPENLYYHLPNREYFNYSTVKDLVKLSQYVLESHPLIFEISLEKGPYLVRNGLSGLSLPENLTLIGGKTGYTDGAEGCFLVVFQDDKGSFFFNLILGAEKEKRIEEMQKLIDWLNSR